MQHGNSSFFPQNGFPATLSNDVSLTSTRYRYLHAHAFFVREQWKINLNYNNPESYTVGRGASEQSHKTLHRVYGIDSMELGTLYFFSDKQEYKPLRCAAWYLAKG